MLTRNYVAIADQTQRPFGTNKSVRKGSNWAFLRQAPSAITVTRYDANGKAVVTTVKVVENHKRRSRSTLDLVGPARVQPKARLCKRWAAL